MSTDIEAPQEQTTAALLTGILSDLQHLVEQQLRLARREIADDLKRRGNAAGLVAAGSAVLFLDSGMWCLTLAYLMHWAASPPATDPASLPLWACHGIIAVVLAITGIILIQVGRTRFKSDDLIPIPPTAIQQESHQWTKLPK